MNRMIMILAAFAAVASAQAQIVSTAGSLDQVSAPASVLDDATENSTRSIIFQERSNFVLGSSLTADAVAAGLYNGPGDLTSVSIAAGTAVASYFLHTDPVGQPVTTYTGNVRFAQRILGVFALRSSLNTTDPILGASGTTYPTGNPLDIDREFELSNNEFFRISADQKAIEFRANTSSRMDQMRIVTEAVPEPATMLALAAGVMPLVSRLRRRSK